MTTANIREKLVDYLKTADDKKVKAIYTMVEDEINTAANDFDDEDFYRELKRRSKEMTVGAGESMTWEEAKKAAKKKVQSKRK